MGTRERSPATKADEFAAKLSARNLEGSPDFSDSMVIKPNENQDPNKSGTTAKLLAAARAAAIPQPDEKTATMEKPSKFEEQKPAGTPVKADGIKSNRSEGSPSKIVNATMAKMQRWKERADRRSSRNSAEQAGDS